MADGDRQYEGGVLTCRDVDAIGLPHAKHFFEIVTTVSPPRSIAILSRMLSFRTWIRATSPPEAVSPFAAVVLDPEVVSDRKQFLAH
jgi:hypothetical protein